MSSRNDLKGWFDNFDKPTGEQFANLIDSFFHKTEDLLNIAKVDGLSAALLALNQAIGAEVQARTTADNNLSTELEGKQDVLTFDEQPTADSDNPVTSGGLFSYLWSILLGDLTPHSVAMVPGLAPDAGEVIASRLSLGSALANRPREVFTYTGGVKQWRFGGNADDTAWYVGRYVDGNFIDYPLVIEKATGRIYRSSDGKNVLFEQVGKQLSDENYTAAEKTKLANLNEHFVGRYPTVAALTTAKPVGADGQYATVDPGTGVDAKQYIWDSDSSTWVVGSHGDVTSVNGQTGPVSLSTADIGEGANPARLYYSNARTLASVLTGLSLLSAAGVLDTDTLLVAIGKLQAQISAEATARTAGDITVGAKYDKLRINLYQSSI